jgi:hypothetical protein
MRAKGKFDWDITQIEFGFKIIRSKKLKNDKKFSKF